MDNNFDQTILKVDARRFIPFREGNVLRSHQADFHLGSSLQKAKNS